MKNQFDMIEEDGVVIYDESDDYDPGQNESEQAEEGGFSLMTNEEIFTDEYMQNYAKKMDAQIDREKRMQRLISIGVIIAVILFVGIISYINFKNIL
ncbi:MAG: hypothetical protein K2K75_06125 [Muribaculaceae bacterium]|nr:hypothetical protein [Muribaculaceae bacterium]